MFAVIRTGGKQYKVAHNEVIVVERMLGDSGSTVDLGDVLIVGDGTKTTVGKPVVDGAKVLATVVEHSRGEKITVFKRKRRQGYRRTAGHQQEQTVLRISDITAPGMKAVAKVKAAAKKPAASKTEADTATKAKAVDTAPNKPAPKKKAAADTAPDKAAPKKKAAAKSSSAEKKPKAAPKAKASTKKDNNNGA
jgi:large subunit ribosomal protein L21